MGARKALFASVTALVALVIAVLGAEVLLRANGFKPFRLSNVDEDEPVIFEPHPALGWKHREGTHDFPPFSPGADPVRMRFLADGGRASGEAGAPGRPPMLLLGGSFTEGFAVSDEQTFAWKLQERFPKLEVKNFGTGGWGTHQSLLMLDELLVEEPAPRIVVYGFYTDHEIRNIAAPHWLEALTRYSRRHEDAAVPYSTVEHGVLVHHPPARYSPWALGRYSATVAFSQSRVAEWRGRRRVGQRRQVSEELILEMDRRCTERGAAFLVVFLLADVPTRTGYKEVLDRNGVSWVDCTRRLTPSLRVPGDGHPNGKLHGLWSRCIGDALEQTLAVD